MYYCNVILNHKHQAIYYFKIATNLKLILADYIASPEIEITN